MDNEKLRSTICRIEFLLDTLKAELFSDELESVVEEPTYINVPVDDYDEVFYDEELSRLNE